MGNVSTRDDKRRRLRPSPSALKLEALPRRAFAAPVASTRRQTREPSVITTAVVPSPLPKPQAVSVSLLQVSLLSKPSGATLKLGEQVVGPTPQAISLRVERVGEKTTRRSWRTSGVSSWQPLGTDGSVNVTLLKPGYQRLAVKIFLTKSQVLRYSLRKIKTGIKPLW